MNSVPLLLYFVASAFFQFAFCQTTTRPAGLAFKAASVRPSSGDAPFSVAPRSAGRFTARSMPLRTLIETAYEVEYFNLLGGPPGLLDKKYDIEASPGRAVTNAELCQMLRTLAKDRFHLAVHEETRTANLYHLTVMPDGIKMRRAAQEARGGIRQSGTTMIGSAASMAALAESLTMAIGAPMIDKTGLTGRYDFVLEWSRDEMRAPTGNAADHTATLPPLPAALEEQLGLRVVVLKGTKKVLVIDHLEAALEN